MGACALALPLFLGRLGARNDTFEVGIDALVFESLASGFFRVAPGFLIGLNFAAFLLCTLTSPFLLRHLVVSRHGPILPDLEVKHF
jgi:hypothetical protein